MTKQELGEMIKEAQEAYIWAKVEYETKCKMARACEQKVMETNMFYDEIEPAERITDAKYAWATGEKEFKRYMALCDLEYSKLGFARSQPNLIPEANEQNALKITENWLLDLGEKMIDASGKFNKELTDVVKKARTHWKYRAKLLNLILSLDTKTMA